MLWPPVFGFFMYKNIASSIFFAFVIHRLKFKKIVRLLKGEILFYKPDDGYVCWTFLQGVMGKKREKFHFELQ